MIIVKSLKSSHRIARFRYSIGSNNITYLHLQIYRNDNFKTYIHVNIQYKNNHLIKYVSNVTIYVSKNQTFTEKIKEDLIHFFNELD